MLPTEILKNEHRVIEQVLNCLEKMADQLDAERTLDAGHARDAVAFFRAFADQCHHGKEEVHLFPMMEARGFSRESGPTGVMLVEHDQGRSHVRGMNDNLEAASQGDATAQRQYLYHARAFIQLLREHIQKEDHCLFSMANQVMTQVDQANLMALFEKVEHEEMGAGTHEKYLKVANDLADAYGIPHAEVAASEMHGAFACSHHSHKQ